MFVILGVDLDFSQLSAHQSKTLEMETQVSKNLFLEFMVSFFPHLINYGLKHLFTHLVIKGMISYLPFLKIDNGRESR